MGAVAYRAALSLPLAGAGGEPIGFAATVGSHGLPYLAPSEIADDASRMDTTLILGATGPRRIRYTEGPAATLTVAAAGPALNAAAREELERQTRAIFAFDDDLAPFYDRLDAASELAFAKAGAGRMLRSPTAFEDVVRTVCTTNCAWSATRRMIEAMVAHLGSPATGADGWRGRAFPSAAQFAAANDDFFRDVARAGYRGPYFRALGAMVASGELDLEAMRGATPRELSDEDLEKKLLALPGVGPYAAAHIMMLFGRGSRLILDSWTRPRYAFLTGKKKVADRTIARRLKASGDHAGRAFWLYLWNGRNA